MKKKQLEQKYDKWKSQLENIVGEVSEKFSAYMKEVDCAGEVRLYRGKNASRGDEEEEGENLVYNFKVRPYLNCASYNVMQHALSHTLSISSRLRTGEWKSVSNSVKGPVFKSYLPKHTLAENAPSAPSCTSWDSRIS